MPKWVTGSCLRVEGKDGRMAAARDPRTSCWTPSHGDAPLGSRGPSGDHPAQRITKTEVRKQLRRSSFRSGRVGPRCYIFSSPLPREQRTRDHANFDIFRVFPVLSGAVRGTVGPSVKWSSNASPPSRRAPDPDRGRSCQSSFERDCQPAEIEPGAPEAMSDRLGLERP